MEKSIYKIVVLGDPRVGKTSLIIRYVDDKFEVNYKATLGFDISIKKVTNTTGEYSLAIWDIAGQEQFTSLRTTYLDGAQGAILVYDVTDPNTFKNLNMWYEALFEITGGVPFILVGNKIDLTEERKITIDKGQEIAKKLGAYKFYETSAKTGNLVQEVFINISHGVHKSYQKFDI